MNPPLPPAAPPPQNSLAQQPTSSPPIRTTSSRPTPSPSGKRRGRPRSPVFKYFNRLVDGNGGFIGNACSFCSFVSKDRSENPTYLTRHILRTCTAPQSIKDTIATKHPSITISSYGGTGRYVKRHPQPFTSSSALITQPSNQTPANGQHAIHHQKPPTAVALHTASSAAQAIVTQGITQHNVTVSNQMNPATAATVQHPSSSQNPPSAMVPQHQHRPRQVVTNAASPHTTNTLPVGMPTNAGMSVSNAQPGMVFSNNTFKTRDPDVKAAIRTPLSKKDLVQTTAPSPSSSAQRYTTNAAQPSATPNSTYPVPGMLVQGVTARPNNSVPTRGTTVTGGRVAKSKRGRPRSQALIHFRRHTDEKGIFIANQCLFCPFVSRDRSENSTLLLRHLLSPSCSCPEEMKLSLRGTKYTADGKRVKKDGGTEGVKAGKVVGKKPGAQGSNQMKNQGNGSVNQVPCGYAVDPAYVSASLVRFFRRHSIGLQAVESQLFKDMIQAVSSTGPTNGVTGNVHSNPDITRALPSVEQLHAFWKGSSQAQLVNSDTVSTNGLPSSDNLLIYFPYTADHGNSRISNVYESLASTHSENLNPSHIASVFRWAGGHQLRYLGTKNCTNDLHTGVSAIVDEAIEEVHESKQTRFDQVYLSRPPVNVDKNRDMMNENSAHPWVKDVARELEILCQELLTQIPVLVRSMRRAMLIASYFRERYSQGTAVVLFGRNAAERDVYNRYLRQISKTVRQLTCRDALEMVKQTYELVIQAQRSHENGQRLQETGSFLHTMSEENAGNVHLCQDVTRFVLSPPIRNDFKMFIALMTPLANLISLYTPQYQGTLFKGNNVSSTSGLSEDVFATSAPFRNRSIAHLLPDSVNTLQQMYAEKNPEFEPDLRMFWAHTTHRLLGKGSEGTPPIVDGICYAAALLNPRRNIPSKGNGIDDWWMKAASFLHKTYKGSSEFSVERAMEQLQGFHQRSGVFASPELFADIGNSTDPKNWWTKHRNVAPDLSYVAMKILGAPTGTFPIVRYISEMNIVDWMAGDFKHAEMMGKKRIVEWNMKLLECRTGPACVSGNV